MKKELLQQFKQVFHKNANDCYFAPGRINLIGEHIDCYGGKVLPMAIDLGTYGVFLKRTDHTVRLFSTNYANLDVITFDLDNYQYKDDWTKYIKGVISVIDDSRISGFDLFVSGTLPTSSGLSSSASLEVLMLYILNDQYNLALSKVDIAKLAQKAENEYVGVNCGIMDQFAIALSKENKAIYLDTATLDYQYVDLSLLEQNNIDIVIINSNKTRDLSSSDYNTRLAECNNALYKLQKHSTIKSLCECDDHDINNDELNDLEKSRVRHVITENERVRQVILALDNKDVNKVGEMIDGSHRSLANGFEVSCFELDSIFAIAKSLKAIGCRMIGAGFGGCAIALVKSNYTLEFTNELLKQYYQKTNKHGSCYIAKTGYLHKL